MLFLQAPIVELMRLFAAQVIVLAVVSRSTGSSSRSRVLRGGGRSAWRGDPGAGDPLSNCRC